MLISGWDKAISMWTVAIPEALYSGMRSLLFESDQLEGGCFLLASHFHAKGASSLLVTGMIAPDGNSWLARTRDSLVPSASFINRCAVRADDSSSSLVFVHSHRDGDDPALFSPIDIESNERLFENLSEILPDRPLASLVFGRGGASGRVYEGGTGVDVDSIKIVGKRLDWVPIARNGRPATSDGAMYDRQIRALGHAAHNKLGRMTVAVVGAGGTGSSVAVQLGRMGVGRLLLIDMDAIDSTSLPRVYGSCAGDIGRPKVDVLRSHIRSFSTSKVDSICGTVEDQAVQRTLLESDVMFSCTDNLTSRSVANEISGRYYIPLIDVGCRVHLDGNGSILQAAAKAQLVTIDGPCLWCTDTLDGVTILHESLTAGEKSALAAEGYYDGLEKQPSIVPLTTMAATLAITKFLGLLGVFNGDAGTRMQAELGAGIMVDDSPDPKPGCICRTEQGRPLARGDVHA